MVDIDISIRDIGSNINVNIKDGSIRDALDDKHPSRCEFRVDNDGRAFINDVEIKLPDD